MNRAPAAIAREARINARLQPAKARDAALAANPPPAELAYLADIIGPAATLRLIEEAGGTRIAIPRTVNQGTRLARMVGLDAARALAGWRGGENVKIPLARHWRIRIYHAEGGSYPAIARKLGITERAVHSNLNAARLTEAAQPDLFAG